MIFRLERKVFIILNNNNRTTIKRSFKVYTLAIISRRTASICMAVFVAVADKAISVVRMAGVFSLPNRNVNQAIDIMAVSVKVRTKNDVDNDDDY